MAACFTSTICCRLGSLLLKSLVVFLLHMNFVAMKYLFTVVSLNRRLSGRYVWYCLDTFTWWHLL